MNGGTTCPTPTNPARCATSSDSPQWTGRIMHNVLTKSATWKFIGSKIPIPTMRQKQSQRQNARQAVNNAAQNMNATMEAANVQEQVTELRQTLREEANDDRPRLWVLPGDAPSHDEVTELKEAIQAECPDYLVKMAVNTTDGGVDEENIHAALFGATPDDLKDDEEGEGHWRFCDGVADPKAPAGSDGKLALEQHTETGEYRTRPYGEVVDAY